MMLRLPLLAGLLALGAVVGCAGGVKPDVVPPLEPVSGKVTVDGEPQEGVAVTFYPGQMNKGNPSTATTNAEGWYHLKHRSGKEGIAAGEYVVLFSKLAQPDGSPIPQGKTAADVGAVEQIPDEYRATDNLQNTVTVPAGGKNFDFDLKTKK